MKVKKIRVVLVLLILINIIVLFTVIGLMKSQNDGESENVSQGTSEATNTGETKEGFKNVATLYQNYKGAIPKSEIAKKIETIIEQYFPILYDQVIANNIDETEYFTAHEVVIKNRFGITDVEDFSNLITQIRKISCNVDDYVSYELLEDSFEDDGEYTKATLIYTYTNGQSMELNFYIKDTNDDTDDVKYMLIP